jgi:hypothetical protein
MAEENRVVRPFSAPDDLQDWMDQNVILEVQPMTDGHPDGDLITVAAGETKRLEPKTYLTAEITLRVSPDADINGFASALTKYAKRVSGGKQVLSIVLYGSSSFLKFSDELCHWSVSEFEKSGDGYKIASSGPLRPRAAKTAHNGASFELVVVLREQLGAVVGMPWRLGTWILRSSFSLGNPLEGFGFTPLPLTKEKRIEFGIGPETFKFARKNPFNGQLFESETLDDFIEFYVDEEVLTRLSAAPRNAQSAFIQTEIFLSAIEYVVLEASTDPDLHDKSLQEINGTLVDKMLRAISTERAEELNKWLVILKNNPQLFLTKYEELVDYKTRLLKSIGEMR